MHSDIAKRLDTSEMIEFTSANYNDNGYSHARYRRSRESVELESFGDPIRVPKKVEVMNQRGEWQQHPAVFVHYGNAENEKNKEGYLVVFRAEGGISSVYYRPRLGDPRKAIIEEAEKHGLTKGDTRNVKAVVKEED